MSFVALDVETANEDLGSICQIGAATFIDGKLAREWKTYVDPEDYFNPINVSLHGINEARVRGAPTFASIVEQLQCELDGIIVVHHTFFDRAAITSAALRYGVRPPGCKWLDSARVARRTWPEVRRRGYGLGPLCDKIGYSYRAHDALEDAKAAGQVLLEAFRVSGAGPEEWLTRAYSAMSASPGCKIAREGDPDGPLWGEVVVFTGALSLPRAEAAGIAARLGCRVAQGVTKEATLLVVGDQDIGKLNGQDKSSKQRKAEQLAAAGQPIRFLSETQFTALTRILDDGTISREEREQARAAVDLLRPGGLPVELGVARRPWTPRGDQPDLVSVQFLRDAPASTAEEAERSAGLFGELLGQDAHAALERFQRLGQCPKADEFLAEMERDVSAFAACYGAATSFVERSSLGAVASLTVRESTRTFARMVLETLRDYLRSVSPIPDDIRQRFAAVVHDVDGALASLDPNAQES